MAQILKNLESKLKKNMEACGVPAACIGVYHKGKLYTAATGILNINTGVEATSDSCFQIGSITKVFTATLVMQLVEQGRLELDKPVKHYIPTFQTEDVNACGAITIRQLLCHTSGLDGDATIETDFGRDKLARFVESCAFLSQIHPPGEYFSYCNTGFNIAGRLIEVATGKTYEEAAREMLIQPLGMDHTAMLPQETLKYRCAIGHVPAPPDENAPDGAAPKMMISPIPVLESSGAPAGSFATMTVADLLKFACLHLDEGKTFDGTQILSKEGVRAMKTKQTSIAAPVSENTTGWGLGWSLMEWDGEKVIGHDGGTVGQNSFLRIIPSKQTAVCLLTNGGDYMGLKKSLFPHLFRELAGVCIPDTPAPKDITANNTLFTGRYENCLVYTEVFEDKGLLHVRFGAKHSLNEVMPEQIFILKPLSPNTFAICTPDHTVIDIGGAAFLRPDTNGMTRYIFLGGRIYKRLGY
ncbi:serine hydrolase domain-containing protein [uncultured Desulfobacter sp.]|uniref:serine hydrolase domain-containing protein n=1 Tax=uncultured Desulfobacter sp. TaxID=240139 RepID=UPI002AABCE6C|nr:serine hydrolase domain-containing protein [uncultured Desulfobacter sp.]